VRSFEDLPKLAQEYLRFLERESGAKIGMVSTGPDREQTMEMPGFRAALDAMQA
jgi:adenylosuccinate synthase